MLHHSDDFTERVRSHNPVLAYALREDQAMMRNVPQVDEIEQALVILNRVAKRMMPFGRLTFQLHWEPNEERIKVVKRRRSTSSSGTK